MVDTPGPAIARTVWGNPQRYFDSYWRKYAAQGWFLAGDGAGPSRGHRNRKCRQHEQAGEQARRQVDRRERGWHNNSLDDQAEWHEREEADYPI